MHRAAITGTGVFTPSQTITNDALVAAYDAYADLENAKHAEAIAAGAREPLAHSSAEFIRSASGIERRHVLDRDGVLDPTRLFPRLRERADDEPGQMAEMAVDAATRALDAAGIEAGRIDAVLCAASNHERAYPAIGIEIQSLLGTSGFAFDMNVACSSATFGIQTACDMIRSGSIARALVVSPEICSAHLEWRDRDCHFIFGDVCTAIVIERSDLSEKGFTVNSTRCATSFSNNIRNNDGFLRRTRDAMDDRRDMQFTQNGRRVFKEVLPLVVDHVTAHLSAEGWQADDLSRLWLHQANKAMNDFIGRRILGRVPTPEEQPNILQDYANTSSAGSIIAFSMHSDDLPADARGLICSFGAGYSVGSVLVTRR